MDVFKRTYIRTEEENGKSGDGVVTLLSQVPLKLQSESTRMYVFNNDHVGTLNDKII